jgi:hypothetical protein
MTKTRLLLACALSALALSVAPAANAWTEVPPFPPDGRVAVRGVDTDFQPLRDYLRRFESQVGAKYHVLVVEYSDPQDRDGPDYGDESGQYIDRVVEAWTPSADAENSVIIVLAIRNRDIIVHPYARWARLGWEANEVKRTIDESSFGVRARAGDYNTAIADLVRAIDRELQNRVAQERELGVRAQELITRAAAMVSAFERETENERLDLTAARVQNDTSKEKLREAEAALAANDPSRASFHATEAEAAARRALALVSEARVADRTARERLPVVRERLARVKRHPQYADSANAKRFVRDAEQFLTTAEEALEQGHSLEAISALDAADTGLRNADDDLVSAAARQRFFGEVLPAILGVLAALAILFVIVLRIFRSSARRKQARALVAEWDTMLGRAGEKLLALENQHALLLADPTFATRFTGASAEPVRDAARRVDDLFLAYDVATRLLREAKSALRAPFGFMRTGPADRVVRRLTVEELVARTEDVQVKKLFLPDKREVRRKPQELLADMETLYADARQRLQSVETRFTAIWASLDGVRAEIDAAEAAQNALSERGHRRSLDPAIDETDRAWDELNTRARTDPLGCMEEGPLLAAKASELRARAERMKTSIELVEAARANLAEASRKVAELRAQSLAVSEPGFEPDVMAEHIERHANKAVASVLVAEDSEAHAHATEASETATELLELVAETDRARTESPGRIDEESARLAKLRERLEERRARLGALRTEHDEQALEPTLDNVDEAKTVLTHAETCLSAAKRSVTSATQHFLAGRELIDRARRDLDAVEALYEEIENKASLLASLRERAEADLAEAKSALGGAEAVFAESDEFASVQTLEIRARSSGEIERIEAAIAAPRPNWARLATESAAAAASAKALVERATAERDAWLAAQEIRERVVAERQNLGASLAAATEDRALANERFTAASGWLDRAIELMNAERPSWPEIAALLRDAEVGLRDARAMAQRDYQAAMAARATIAELDADIRTVDIAYGYGVHADLQGPKASYAEAARLLSAGEYEQALRTATAAKDAVRAAGREAQVRVRVHEMGRRERESSWSSSRSVFGTSRSTFGTSRSSSFGSRSSSIGSRSSIGSSSRSSSFGSSASRSSSRSSFGSSSGRSSFGRSSGRSKW